MSEEYVQTRQLRDAAFLERLKEDGSPLGFELELTARCNNDCRHCLINLPAGDTAARDAELTLGEIERIAEEAVELGTFWCLVTGGEPLLREDFAEIYTALRRLGLLTSVFTNACLVSREHVCLFREQPPRDVEVTVYGVTQETYERVTGRAGSWRAFCRGVGLLLDGGVRVRFKAVALQSNVDELPQIAEFCRLHTCDYFRFDAMLHLRYDGDEARNALIRAERLSPERIAFLDREDSERWAALEKSRDRYVVPPSDDPGRLFRCGVLRGNFAISPEGIYRPCSSLWAPGFTSDLRRTSLKDARRRGVGAIAAARTGDPAFAAACGACQIGNLCLGCPAHFHLETNHLDAVVPYFCAVAHARAATIGIEPGPPE